MKQFSDTPITRYYKDSRCCCKELAVRLGADQRNAIRGYRPISSDFQSGSRSEKSLDVIGYRVNLIQKLSQSDETLFSLSIAIFACYYPFKLSSTGSICSDDNVVNCLS